MKKSRNNANGESDGASAGSWYSNGMNLDDETGYGSESDSMTSSAATISTKTSSSTKKLNNGSFNTGSGGEISNGLQHLIPFINKLQTIFRATGIDSRSVIQLPQIVVVGAQSSGKSSVLESLVQKSFLPRGAGMITRCPIVLKLINTSNQDTPNEYCEFLHLPNKRMTDFKEVEKEIINHTEKIAGNNCEITKDSIQLTVYSPNVVTLTVVDLPGLVKMPTKDQSKDIKDKIRELVVDYISQENSIILAVTAANIDLATSDSLEIAKEVDPNGNRTLAVLTKLDLTVEKPEILKVLKGQVIPVKLGIIGVINRSQDDIKANRSIKETIDNEKRYLTKEFPSIASQHGSIYLSQRLNRLLLQHIETCFPLLDMKLKELEIMYKERMDELGSHTEMDEEEKRQKMIDIISDFSAAYKAQVDGRPRNMDLSEVCGGARIDHIFQVNLIEGLKALSPLVSVTDKQIITAIRNSRQIGSRLSVIEDAFQALVKTQIGKMRSPVMDCANRIYQEMINMVPKCLSRSALRFPKVNRSITQILSEILHENFQNSRHVLEQYMDIQASSAITAQEDFYQGMEECVRSLKVNGIGNIPVELLLNVKGRDELLVPCGTNSSTKNSKGFLNASSIPNDVEDASIDVDDNIIASGGSTATTSDDIHSTEGVFSSDQTDAFAGVRKLMDRFFDIVLKQVQDYVPKSLLHTLVYATVNDVDKELNKKLAKDDKVVDLMKESEEIISIRDAISNDLRGLEEACTLLEEVREKSVF